MPIRIAFVLFYVEAWDSLAETHRLMSRDDRFEVKVVAVPKRLTGDVGFDDAADASSFLSAAGIEHDVWAFEDDGSQAAELLRDWAPDYVFMNYPWQRNYQRKLRPDALIKFTRIAYVPYFSLSLVKEPDGAGGFIDGVAPHYFTQRMHQVASLIFVQSDEVREAFAGTERGTHGVVVVGSPKLDAMVAEYESSTRLGSAADAGFGRGGFERRVVFAPHHSYSPHWLNFGTFAHVKDSILGMAITHAETQFVLRAHPFMWGTLVDRKVLTRAEVDAWLAAWNALPNTADSATWSLAEVFDCEVLISDGISFLAEYPLVTGRPGLFIERADHWPFTPLGELAAAANLAVDMNDTNVAIFENLLQQFESTPNPQLSHAIANLKRAAMPHAGQAANRIVESVLSHWSQKPGLVDTTTITEVPWELQTGREPQD
ncbi:MAG: hypothetical protein KGL77_03865 [Actinomycetales bacterium]|nr:hypothetical protein [Actinomycetales bacterium]